MTQEAQGLLSGAPLDGSNAWGGVFGTSSASGLSQVDWDYTHLAIDILKGKTTGPAYPTADVTASWQTLQAAIAKSNSDGGVGEDTNAVAAAMSNYLGLVSGYNQLAYLSSLEAAGNIAKLGAEALASITGGAAKTGGPGGTMPAGSGAEGIPGEGSNPVATEKSTAFFWSGRTGDTGGEDIAAQIAQQNGGTTLEMLIKQNGIQMPAWDASNPAVVQAWQDISAKYAAGASGTVRAVIGSNLRPGNVWESAELPALIDNPKVTQIITIDPATGASNVIFSRGK
ncbi:hypothetical protein [Rhizobium sp. BK376]|uniref:hypothetical protein n=1 Tax=Rhizobium sp. BK376 TaxID=2512149 RepID=UPI0010438F6B|nr:hypothetical protein [Rhizobium sp. BK376]TCR62902.1 hypothetical protein EV561_1732 [Rhizobium sp. BK376]